MNVIKKTVAILFIFILTACSTDQETFEEQNIPITSSLRTQEGNSISETVIQFREHISEEKRDEIRDQLISSGFLIDFYILPIEPEPNAERWVHLDSGCIWDSRTKRYLKWDPYLEIYVPCPITPIGTLEDDGVLQIIINYNNGDGQGEN
jgi:hypothetical protein